MPDVTSEELREMSEEERHQRMSEIYDAAQKWGHEADPTEGPWEWGLDVRSGECFVTTHAHEDRPAVATSIKAAGDARLIAAAGTAASELPEDYDPVEVLEALPEILRAAGMAVDSTMYRDENGHAHPPDRSHMLDLRDALARAEGKQQ